MQTIITLISGYLVGSFNPAYLIGRLKGIDIRESGTGNAGSTNALFVLGKKAGILVFVSDVLKTILVMTLVGLIWDSFFLVTLAGIGCFIGHAFPYYMHFKGGKGSACFLGIVIRLSPHLIPIMVVIAFIVAYGTDMAFLFPVSAIFVYPFLLFLKTREVSACLVLAVLIPLTLFLHRMNFKKVKTGEEFGFKETLFRKGKKAKEDVENTLKAGSDQKKLGDR